LWQLANTSRATAITVNLFDMFIINEVDY